MTRHSGPLTDHERINLIIKAMIDCNEEATEDAIGTQFYYETGRQMPSLRRREAREDRPDADQEPALQPPTSPEEG